MDSVKYVSYSDWSSLISEIMKKGLACEELNKIQDVYPHSVGESYDAMIYNQLARLEQYMIRETVNIFKMSEEIIRNMQSFSGSFLKYLKKLEYEDNSTFIQDYVYVCKKNLKKIENMY